MEKCPVELLKEGLLSQGVIEPGWYHDLVQETDRDLDAALKFAKASPFPAKEELHLHVYFEKGS
jgi:TPP-dependent pyruvate/acetoin dehydrogenase alpha subunit